MAVRKADESDRLFVVEVGMENRAPEERHPVKIASPGSTEKSILPGLYQQ